MGSLLPLHRFRWAHLLVVVAVAAAALFFKRQVEGAFTQPPRSPIHGYDDSHYLAWLRAAVFERPFDFKETLRLTPTLPESLKKHVLAQTSPTTGRVINKYGVGWALAGAPFYLAADAGLAAGRAAGWTDAPRDGLGNPYQLALLGGQLVYAAAGLALAWRIVRRWVPDPWALEGVAACWLGSFLFTYQTWMLSMAHNLVFFAVCWMFWAALRLWEGRAGPGIWWQLGLAGGLALVTRYQSAVYFIFPAWIVFHVLRRPGSIPWAGLGGALAGGLLILTPQLAGWKLIYGQWIVYSYGGEGFDWFSPKILEVLFSPFHGLFYWSPLLLLSLAGFLGLLRSEPRVLWPWAATLAATLWINAAWHTWWFGAAVGARAFEGCVLFFMAGTAWLLHLASPHSWRLWALRAVLALGMAFSLILSHQVHIGKLSAEKPVTYGDVWRSLGW
jgi:hypothetical protein